MRGRLRAFTLVELVIVIAIIGILAAIAIPRFVDLRAQAYGAQFNSVVGGVRAGILTVSAQNQVQTSPSSGTFPPDLEGTWGGATGGSNVAKTCGPAAGSTNPCFELVLHQPIEDGVWAQTGTADPSLYTFTPPVGTAKTCTYTSTSGTKGTFNCL